MAVTNGGGWAGKVLRVDLTTRTITTQDTFPTYEQYWGGAALGMRVLWNEVTPGTHPYSPSNKLIFNTGALNGTGAPSSGRVCMTTFSSANPWFAPSTGHMGGYFGPELKYAGYDAVILEGKASGPVYLKIIDSDVEIVDCPQIWGCGTFRAQAEISQALGGKSAAVAAIGQSGEAMQPQSAIMTGWKHAASTCGDVMGSKNLKAIGVLGTGKVRIAASKKAWRALIENAMALIGSNNQACAPNTPQPWAEYVSGSGTRWWGSKGRFWGAARPIVETGTCEPHDRQSNGYRCWKIDWVGQADYLVRMDGCFSCPVRCNSVYYVPNAEDYGVSAYGSGTCTGSTALQGSIDTAPQSKIGGTGAALTNLEASQKKMTSAMMSDHFSNDNGWTCNYGMGGPQIKWIIDGTGANTLPNGVKAKAGEMYIKPNCSAAEWTMLNKVVAAPSDTNKNGLFNLIATGNLQAYRELARLLTMPDGDPGNATPSVFGRMAAGAVEYVIDTFVDAFGRPLRHNYFAYDYVGDARTSIAFPGSYWGKGHPEHHLNGWVGLTSQIDYNRDPQNHQWQSPILGNGFPADVGERVLESQMAKAGLGAGWGPTYSMNLEGNPPTMFHAKAAQFNHCMKECVDALGTCNWMYPWIYSPLKERGYEGDVTLEAQYFNAATGNNLTFMEFYDELKRFYLIQRILTAQCMKAMTPPAGYTPRPEDDGWGALFTPEEIGVCGSEGAVYYSQNPADKGNLRLYHDHPCLFEDELVHEEWGTLMDNYYTVWGCNLTNGWPTRATLEALGAKDVADRLQTEGLLG